MAAQEGMTRRRPDGNQPSAGEQPDAAGPSRDELVSRSWATIMRAMRNLTVEEQRRVIEAMAVLLGMKVVKE